MTNHCKVCGAELERCLAGNIDNGVDNTYIREYCPCCGWDVREIRKGE